MCASKSSSCNRSVIFPSATRFLSTRSSADGEDGNVEKQDGSRGIRFSGCFVFSNFSFFSPPNFLTTNERAVVYLRPRTKAARNLRVAHTFRAFSDVILLSVEIRGYLGRLGSKAVNFNTVVLHSVFTVGPRFTILFHAQG